MFALSRSLAELVNSARSDCLVCARGPTTLRLWPICKHWLGLADFRYGQRDAGFFGYGHMTGGWPGGQSEYVRVPFGEVNLLKVPKELSGKSLASSLDFC